VNLDGLLELWAGAAGKYEVQTVLERAVGRTTPPACAALVAQGKSIVTIVDANASGERVRAAYGQRADVRVAGNDDVELPRSDLVLIHGGRPEGDWQDALAKLAKYAAKLVVVAADNPHLWSVRARSLFARMTGDGNGESGRPAWGTTAELAPALWEIGRVREHAFLDAPPLGERSARLLSSVAPRHAFVVDVTPRTPQARRRLRLGA
jgi:hypothetical protein